MILVTVGASQVPFDRLVRGAGTLAGRDELVVQHGPSRLRPAGATCLDFLPFDRLAEHVRLASTVVTHGGVGSILVALANGKRPIVVPRRKAFREAVDDHQVECAARFARAGLVRVVDDPAELAAALDAEAGQSPAILGGSALAADLGGYLAGLVAPSGRVTA
jgi:UDP-N-acetylglucosamine transferase subunit ALG13